MATENKNRVFRNFALRKGLAVLVLVVAVGALPACFIETSSSPPPPVCTVAPAVTATWSIDKAGTGALLSCDQAAASMVELSLNGTKFDFSCNANQGITTELPPGGYTAQFTLLGLSGQVLSTTQSMAITVPSCGVLDLGDIPFTVN
jgi:hypothetical protein